MVQDLEITYKNSQAFANSHYENFPVISFTLPKSIRKHVAIVYQFARQADDFADEGDFLPEERIEKLLEYEEQLKKCLSGNSSDKFWMALQNTVEEKKLDSQYLFDLLSAFKQDVVKKRYESYEQLLDYCKRSANPVGRIMLQLFDINDSNAFYYSDSICTGLQLTNFYQDVSIDYTKNRIYLPMDEIEKFGLSENIFEKKQNNAKFKSLMKHQVNRTYKLFDEGKNILPLLPRSFLIQMKMTIYGGEKILKKIESIDFDVMNRRPKLSKKDYLGIFTKGLF